MSYHVFFDANDERLLDILNDILDRKVDHSEFKTLLTPFLRPHGIKELAATPRLRIAYAITNLLGSLQSDRASERIQALTALRDEVLTAAGGPMRINRARVMIQIVKELIRAQGDRATQLQLAHDFRLAALGKTRFIRAQLQKYHLLEMPEEWNQVTFDDRVHDANSKGRKSATHLIMDAWVKGIRRLSVIYYDHLTREVALELFSAARVLGIDVRVGIERQAVFRDRFIKIIWSPKGLVDETDVKGFFRREQVRTIMAEGRAIEELKGSYVKAVAEAFNTVHRQSILAEFGVQLPEVDWDAVLGSVANGHPTLLHLGKVIHEQALHLFRERVESLRAQYEDADYDAKAAMVMQVESLNSLDAETIVVRYLMPEANPDLTAPDRAPCDTSGDDSRCLSPAQLAVALHKAYPSSRLILTLAGLDMADVLEILYDCSGAITHLEMFNLKTMDQAQVDQRRALGELQRAINEQNAVSLKRIIRTAMDAVAATGDKERLQNLDNILQDFDRLRSFYKQAELKTRIGSGSTGRSMRTPGMGFAVNETLPSRVQSDIRRRGVRCMPLRVAVNRVVEYLSPGPEPGLSGKVRRWLSRFPGVRSLVCEKRRRWRVSSFQVQAEDCGNVAMLGGVSAEPDNGLTLFPDHGHHHNRPDFQYLNSTLLNFLKVVAGFLPAFLTFVLTKDWWVLAWFGGLIWFGITGLRNVIQSVLGGGGFRRSPYLRWNDYVSWGRIADSLLFTGFSVPLLDWLCKSVVLDQGFNINTATNPLMLYTIMAITNGVYISSHNIFRGLPREAAVANFFRSVLSIPIAVAFNWVIGYMLMTMGVAGVDHILQLWAAVISKLASDCVAGVIEGFADRNRNIRMRHWDYAEKLRQVFETFSRLEVRFPNRNMLDVLDSPKEFMELCAESEPSYIPIVIANGLDLLHLRMYMPRASEALARSLEKMNAEELDIFLASQRILERERDVSRLFVDGLVGRDFSRALSFYLLRHRDYLAEMEQAVTTARMSQTF